jgi:phasin family protein
MMNKPFSPFGDVDFGKLMGEFKMPGLATEAMVGAYRKNIEALTSASQVAVEGMQAVVKRQAEILRESMDEYARIVRDFSAPSSAEDAAAKQAELAKHTFETTLVHMRELGDMIAKTNKDSLEVLNHRIAEMMEEFKRSAKKATKK